MISRRKLTVCGRYQLAHTKIIRKTPSVLTEAAHRPPRTTQPPKKPPPANSSFDSNRWVHTHFLEACPTNLLLLEQQEGLKTLKKNPARVRWNTCCVSAPRVFAKRSWVTRSFPMKSAGATGRSDFVRLFIHLHVQRGSTFWFFPTPGLYTKWSQNSLLACEILLTTWDTYFIALSQPVTLCNILQILCFHYFNEKAHSYVVFVPI